jgi:hypothetical protein
MSIIPGQRFGRWTAVEQTADHVASSGRRYARWLCLCDCGNTKPIAPYSLTSGNSSSCGCFRAERVSECRTTHGHTRKRNGQASPEYKSWQGMLARCYRPSHNRFERYGARGITVCDRWNPAANGSFENFLSDMGPLREKGLSIERINNDGNYEPTNCKWSSAKEQANNRGTTKWVVYEGKLMCLLDASRQSGINYGTLRDRIKAGWPEEQLFAPVRPMRTRQR